MSALDSFQPHAIQAANWGTSRPRVGPVTQLAATMSPYTAQSSYGKTIEQLKHFTYWNYTAVDLIATRCSEHVPMLSYEVTSPSDSKLMTEQSRFLSQDQRDWVRQYYNVCQSSQDDLDPLPKTHPLAKIIKRPNDEDTWGQFVYEHFLFLRLTGQVYWWKIPNGFGLPTQVAVIPTQWVRPDIDRDGFIYQYSVMPDGGSYKLLELPPEQVAYGMLKNPRNKRWGYSPLEAAPYWTTNAESIELSRNSSFSQGVNPDMLLELGESYSDPSDGVLERIKEKFLKRASGTRRAGEPLVMPPDIKATKWSNTPKDMDYGTTGDIARDSNLALHKVPKVLLGITTDINRNTIEGANVILAENVLNPSLAHFAGMLTFHLGQPYDPRIVCWYETVTPRNEQLELQQDIADFSMGALDPDEQRQKRGRKAKGELAYTSGYLPAGLHPISEEMAQQAADQEAEAQAAQMEHETNLIAAKNGGDQANNANNDGTTGQDGEKTPATTDDPKSKSAKPPANTNKGKTGGTDNKKIGQSVGATPPSLDSFFSE